MDYEKYMRRAYELAIGAGKKGHDTFGAVLVHNGEILEEAENTTDRQKATSDTRSSIWFINVPENIPRRFLRRRCCLPAARRAKDAFAPSRPSA